MIISKLYICDLKIKNNFWQLTCHRTPQLGSPESHEPLFFYAGEYDPANLNEPDIEQVEKRHDIKLSWGGNNPTEADFNRNGLIEKAIADYKNNNKMENN